MGTLTLSFAAFNVFFVFVLVFFFLWCRQRKASAIKPFENDPGYRCIYGTQPLTPYLKHMQSSAVLPVVTSDQL